MVVHLLLKPHVGTTVKIYHNTQNSCLYFSKSFFMSPNAKIFSKRMKDKLTSDARYQCLCENWFIGGDLY